LPKRAARWPASIPLRLDDFRHGHAELILDQHHFAAGDQTVVDMGVDGFADLRSAESSSER
jgi:hypothetical protein